MSYLQHVLHVQLYQFIMAVLQEGQADPEHNLPPLNQEYVHDSKHYIQ